MMRFTIAVVAVVAIVSTLVNADNQCANVQTCAACVANPHHNATGTFYCGFCMPPGKVINEHHQIVPNQPCQSFTPGQKKRFECVGGPFVEICPIMYSCNPQTFECYADPAGTTKDQCLRNCINNGTIYTCDKETFTCKPAKPGTPGASSLAVCSQSCTPPNTATATGSPASQHPAPPPTTVALFTCNYTSGQCVPSVPGKGESQAACEASCHKGTTTYMCDSRSAQCVPLPPQVPGGMSLQKCEDMCNPSPAPGPPPGIKTGLYRGLLIGQNYADGVVYVDIQQTQVTFVHMKNNQVVKYIQGTPSNAPPNPHNEHVNQMTILITAPASLAGQTFSTIADTNGINGPENIFITMAMANVGSPAPSSVISAMTSPTQDVAALAKCLTPECKFQLPALPSSADEQALKLILAEAINHPGNKRQVRLMSTPVGGSFTDPCTQFGASCPVCLANEGCGWCATNVTYLTPSGQIEQGSQCSGEHAGTTPWTCDADYSILSCSVGYYCDNTTLQCLLAPPGDGVPLEACKATCTTAPTMAPAVQQYVCNTTLNQCFQCNATSCAGGMPMQQCEAACAHHKHGPPSHLVGIWRGFFIQAGYKDVEMDLVFNNETVTAYLSGKELYTASVTSFGNNDMQFKYLTGIHKGFTRNLYYQESQEPPQDLYEAITVAEGLMGGPVPESFPPAMTTAGMDVLVFYKCVNPVCQFKQP